LVKLIIIYIKPSDPTILNLSVKVKVKQSHYRPGVAQRIPGSLRFPDFMTTAQEGGRVVNLTHRPPLPPGNPPGAHIC